MLSAIQVTSIVSVVSRYSGSNQAYLLRKSERIQCMPQYKAKYNEGIVVVKTADFVQSTGASPVAYH
jgi:pyrroline-5-carboxylate reductase